MELETKEVEKPMAESSEPQDDNIGISNIQNCGLQSFDNREMRSNKDDYKSVIFKLGESFLCPECKQTTSNLTNLKRHVNLKHPNLLSSLFPSFEKYPHKCNICQKNYNSKISLQGHNRRVHNIKYTNIKKHKCPLCPQEFERRNVSEHFVRVHNQLLKPIKLNFSSYEDFCEWKIAIERATKSLFLKQYTRDANGIIRHVFVCHRSGTFTSKGNENRKLKAQGSKKINAFCPAVIKVVVIKNEKCEVEFQSQHFGHENELHHLSLSYEERKYVADKLATNLSLSDILNDIRNLASENGSEKLRLLTRKDLHNIKSSVLKDKHNLYSSKTYKKLTSDLRDIHNRHTESEQLKADIAKTEKGWILTFVEHGERYLIKENSKSCDCPLICSYCKACIKSYICNCSDSSVDEKMCKHIHFFCMEKNKIQHVSDVNDPIDCNNDMSEITSDSDQSCIQISYTCSLSELSNGGDISVNFESKNMLKNKFSGLIDSITNKEEYKLLQNTFEELSVKLKSVQNSSMDNDDTVISASSSLKSVSSCENKQEKHNSNSSKVTPKPLQLEFLNPATHHGAKVCYIRFAKTK